MGWNTGVELPVLDHIMESDPGAFALREVRDLGTEESPRVRTELIEHLEPGSGPLPRRAVTAGNDQHPEHLALPPDRRQGGGGEPGVEHHGAQGRAESPTASEAGELEPPCAVPGLFEQLLESVDVQGD